VATWFALIFTLGAWLLGDNLVFFLGSLLLGTILGAFLLARRGTHGIDVARVLPARARAGVETRLRYEVRNARPRAALGLLLEDRPEPSARPVSVQIEVDAVPARGAATCETDLTFHRRGPTALLPVTLSTRYPLGLFRRAVRLPAAASVLVRPREGRPTALLRHRVVERAPETSARTLLRAGDDALYGVREFREGDDPRRIHWRTTARRGATVLTEWRTEAARQVVLCLGRGVGAGGGAGRTFERAVSVAATVWRLLHRERMPATLLLGDGRGGEGESGPARRSLDGGLDRLARVGAQAGRRPHAALALLGRRGGTRCIVYVGCGAEPGLARRLAAAAGRGGQVLALRCDGPGIARWVRGLP
jgi:uncharacterized protein (DUF58 family)